MSARRGGRAQRENPQRLPPPRHPRVPETGGVPCRPRALRERLDHARAGAQAQAGGSRTRDGSPGIGRRASAPRRGTARARAEGPGPRQGPFARGLRVHTSPVAQNIDLWRKNYRVRRRRLSTDLTGLLGTCLGPPDPRHHPIPASGRSGWATWSTPEAGEPRRQARRARGRDTPHRDGRRRGQGPPRTTAPPYWDLGRGREGKRTTEAPPTNGPPTAHASRPAGRPASGGGKTGEEKSSRTDRDPARAPVPVHPPRPPRASPAGPGPGPRRRDGTRHRPTRARTRAGVYLSPATRAGGVRSRLPIGTWVKIPAEARPATGPREGPPPGPRVPGRAIPRGPGSVGTLRSGTRGRENKVRSTRKGRRRAGPAPGPGGRAGARARPALSTSAFRFPEGGGAPASAGRHDRAAWGTGGGHSLRNLHLQSPANGRRAVATAPPGRFRR